MKTASLVVRSQRRAEVESVLNAFCAVSLEKRGQGNGYAYATGYYEGTLKQILTEKLSKKDYDEVMTLLRNATTRMFLENN